MKRITFKLAGRVLAFCAIAMGVGCSGRVATEDPDVDVGAAASRPAASESSVTAAPAERPAPCYVRADWLSKAQ